MITNYDIVIRPLITEKATKQVETRKYSFEVKCDTNKVEIKKAIEALYNVKVKEVNVVNMPRKKKRVGKYTGLRPAVKKAIVTLHKDYKISDVFEV